MTRRSTPTGSGIPTESTKDDIRRMPQAESDEECGDSAIKHHCSGRQKAVCHRLTPDEQICDFFGTPLQAAKRAYYRRVGSQAASKRACRQGMPAHAAIVK